MKTLTALFFVVAMSAIAQPYEVPQVPHKLNFAGITLTIRDDARRDIQKDVDALWQSPRHFNIKVERAKTYFPIIEKIFAEERVPDDFKFLVLQESALIPDAVSVSNAVGFWQFKDFTAMEMGLRVDDIIDERMNIASASRGAAKYIKQNNYRFNNWIYALQAYQMGAGGVLRAVEDTESGTKHMTITSNTYWYVKKFLAHKVAFEKAVASGQPLQPVSTYESKGEQSLEEIAEKVAVPAASLLQYNKWIRQGSIPNDRTYAILIPLPAEKLPTQPIAEKTIAKAESPQPAPANNATSIIVLNGLPAIKSMTGETMTALAKRAGVSLPAFMTYNDLQGFEKVIANQYYYAARKKNKADQSQVFAKQGDDLWSISQQHGVSLMKLKKYNRTTETQLKEGQAVWLSSKMPKTFNTRMDDQPTIKTDDSYFSWGASSTTANAIVKSPQSHEDNAEANRTNNLTIHTVAAGENLNDIARKYGHNLSDLIRWNSLGENRDLSPGQKLQLTDNQLNKPQEGPAVTVHEVKPSDTLYGIARQYGITIKELMEWNGKKDFSLSIGEKLKVRNTETGR